MIISVKSSSQMTFEDLRGLRLEGYIRDSKLDQRDGFGPETQRHNEERFAAAYGLALGSRWYTEFVSGRSVDKREEFQQLLEDAALDLFDVLLVDHTCRFGRNQAECIRYKDELQQLGKIVIFVSQGIISGSDRDFLTERINETLDEQYSRNLSRYVIDGLSEKASQGHAIGSPPLGYRTEKHHSGRGAWCVADPDSMPALLAALRGYSSGIHSFRTLAQELNVQGYRTATGKPSTESSISTILNNRFYEGKVVYHRGQADEQVIDGAHQVPEEVHDLWDQCQLVRESRNRPGQPSPRSKDQRIYPLTGALVCDEGGEPFHGVGTQRKNGLELRMFHSWRRCEMRPRSASVSRIEEEFVQRVLGCLVLDDDWNEAVLHLLAAEGTEPDNSAEIRRIDAAITNLKKQHLWGAVTDQEFKDGFRDLQRQRRTLAPRPSTQTALDLERAAKMLRNLPRLWRHPGITAEQRRDLAREIFEEVRFRDGRLTAVRPHSQYAPLFAYDVWSTGVGGECST